MKIIKSFGLVISMILMSSPCFAGTRFYCPAPSNFHTEETSPGQYMYVGTNENGIVFESIFPLKGDAKKALALVHFQNANWTLIGKVGECTYADKNGVWHIISTKNAKSYLPARGGKWESVVCAVLFKCFSSNEKDCPFEFES